MACPISLRFLGLAPARRAYSCGCSARAVWGASRGWTHPPLRATRLPLLLAGRRYTRASLPGTSSSCVPIDEALLSPHCQADAVLIAVTLQTRKLRKNSVIAGSGVEEV
jgi:hypothetical protein